MKISEVFGKGIAYEFEQTLKIATIEEAMLIPDERLLRVRGFGKIRLNKLRSLKVPATQFPHREICGLCHRVVAVGFWVPDEIWSAVVHTSRVNDIHCLNCFIERADEKLIDWSKDIQFFPVSMRAHVNQLFT